MFEAILQAIAAHERIILHRHTHPDGDALGSQIGLKHLLRENFPGKQVYMVGDGAGRYDFMEDSVMDDVPDEAYRDAMAIILDTSAPGAHQRRALCAGKDHRAHRPPPVHRADCPAGGDRYRQRKLLRPDCPAGHGARPAADPGGRPIALYRHGHRFGALPLRRNQRPHVPGRRPGCWSSSPWM